MIVIGVDAGATRTRVAVWREEQGVGSREGPAGAIRPGRVLQSSATIAGLAKAALAQAGLTQADVLVVGAAGAGRRTDADELRVALRAEYVAERVVITTDVQLALAALPPGPGIVLLAGTGSVAVARMPDGAVVQHGGHGWQMGDEGSGYWISRQALTAVGRARDGRGAATALEAALLQTTGSTGFRDLVAWAATAAPREVASLAGTVVRVAESGDAVAERIVQRAAEELVTLVGSLGLEPGPVRVSGGLLADDSGLRARVDRALSAKGFGPVERIDPLRGALALARTPGSTPAP
jgi:N-acetylglucosamine kinase-like BadF-type ATPase